MINRFNIIITWYDLRQSLEKLSKRILKIKKSIKAL